MTRKIKKTVTTEVVITSDEEYALLRHMIDTRTPNDTEHDYPLRIRESRRKMNLVD